MSPVKLGVQAYNSDYMFTVDSSNSDVTRAFISGRDRCRDMFDLVQLPGTRERRRIIGEIVLKAIDFYAGKDYPDTICLARSNFDTHGFTVDPLLLYHPTGETPYIARIPLRALLSPAVDNLLTTGLGISAQRDAMPLIRMQSDIQNQGYAAGLVSAGAVINNCGLRDLKIEDIQAELKEMDFLTSGIVEEETELNTDAAIFDDPDINVLEDDYLKNPDFEKALRLAHLGSGCGSDLLKDIIQNTPWDDGWDYRGMGQFGKSVSRQDSALLALSRLPENSSDIIFLLPKLKITRPETSFSHIRAVCVYLMSHPSQLAADELRRILGKFECHAVNNFRQLMDMPYQGVEDVVERNFQLRELYLAGALNFCAPGDELAEKFLSAYRNGLHKFYAHYAEMWSR